ncbi:MAG: 23S rRNA (adenine(2503)-C(2))-methyltransferase RlmN [Bacilli bacterium]|jgi:23S rRNA (adenine2503-C2)-methyltransferase
MTNFFDLTYEKLAERMAALGQKPYRATQLFDWVYGRGVSDVAAMSDVSKAFREQLQTLFSFDLPSIHVRQDSSDGTVKLLLKLSDGLLIETVLMRYNYGQVVCVSSQVGCNMGCSFCASGLLKRQRNLTPSELLGQVLTVNRLLIEEGQGQRVTHVVIMGTGEPFDNYDNVMDFIRLCNHPKALAIGARHLTVSTCGIPDRIRQYAQEGLQINLAISLHAPNDELRTKLMKINGAYPLSKLIPAVRYYVETAGRRVTFEYILIDGINDGLEQAEQLTHLIKGILAYVNLIPYNEVMENGYRRSPDHRVKAFLDYLTRKGVTATIRKEFGTDIDAACGQLRAKHEKTR